MLVIGPCYDCGNYFFIYLIMQRARFGVPAGILVSLVLATVALAGITAGSSSTAFSTNVAYSEVSVDTPADVGAGDILIANITFLGGTGPQITIPDGWNVIEHTNKGNEISIASYWKLATGSEPDAYIWRISPTTRAAGGITRFSGVDAGDPIGPVSESSGRGTTATAPSITTTTEDSQLVALFSIDAGLFSGGRFSAPNGMSEKYDISYAPLGPSTALDVSAQSSAGASGSKSSTFSKSIKQNWVSQLIALNPRPSVSIPEPIAYWKFDESSGDAADATGNGKTLTNMNSILYASGRINNGADLEYSSSQYFSRANEGYFDTTTGTLSCWIKAETLDPSPGNPSIFSSATNVTTGGLDFGVAVHNGDVLFGYMGAGNNAVLGNTPLATDTWYMATFTWNQSGKELFLNGVSDGTNTADETLTAGETSISIGRYQKLNFNFFDGIIDECGIWDTVLTNEQIESLYNSGNGRTYPF
ncbi:LamG domain-containing protein [bacterium]|nr:LamG domain-containing protein [bacterium]